MTPEIYFSIFKPDIVFSLVFFIGFLGFGYFVDKHLWPWFKDYKAQQMKLEQERLLSQQQRWDNILSVLGELRQEMVAFRETNSIILAYFITDNPNKQTRDLLLKKIEGK